ncbi:hypothetical protein [Achromobacter aloeverae]
MRGSGEDEGFVDVGRPVYEVSSPLHRLIYAGSANAIVRDES